MVKVSGIYKVEPLILGHQTMPWFCESQHWNFQSLQIFNFLQIVHDKNTTGIIIRQVDFSILLS